MIVNSTCSFGRRRASRAHAVTGGAGGATTRLQRGARAALAPGATPGPHLRYRTEHPRRPPSTSGEEELADITFPKIEISIAKQL